MAELPMLAITSLWLGLLTSISPCPLATNIAAISYISRELESPRRVFLTGLSYTLGRMLVYLIIGMALISSLLAAPTISNLLQDYMNMLLGPILILSGMVLLEMINLRLSGPGPSRSLQERISNRGILGAFLLGVIFALSFCPVSAALFFGSLIPLALKAGSGILLPSTYGIGTAFPVIIFALLISFGAQSLSKTFNLATQIEHRARSLTGLVFIGVGIYYSVKYIFLA